MKGRLLLGGLCIAGLGTALIAEQQGTAQEKNTSPQAGQTAGAARDQSRNDRQHGDSEDRDMANASPEQKFTTCAARNDMFEIEAGKLVASKAQNDQVKKIAQMMVDDHTKHLDQLKQASQKANAHVPARLLAWQQAKLEYMSKAPAADLEAEYSFHLVAAHHMAILSTQRGIQKLQDQGLKQLAQNTLKDLRGHLQHANSVAMQFSGGQSGEISGEPVSPGTEGGADHKAHDPGTSGQNKSGATTDQNSPDNQSK